MSSFELLELLEGLPEPSRYKGALRGLPFGIDYEWGPAEYREAALARQLAPLDDDGDMSVSMPLYVAYFSPLERLAIESQQRAHNKNITGAKSAIRSGLYARVPDERR